MTTFSLQVPVTVMVCGPVASSLLSTALMLSRGQFTLTVAAWAATPGPSMAKPRSSSQPSTRQYTHIHSFRIMVRSPCFPLCYSARAADEEPADHDRARHGDKNDRRRIDPCRWQGTAEGRVQNRPGRAEKLQVVESLDPHVSVHVADTARVLRFALSSFASVVLMESPLSQSTFAARAGVLGPASNTTRLAART